MSEAREAVLGRIRRALAATGGMPPAGPAPDFRRHSGADREALVAEFTTRAEGYKVKVVRTARAGARETVARLLAERGHVHIAIPPDLPPDVTPEGFDLLRDENLDNMTLAGVDGVLTTCACAIAQTGTLVLDHGVGQGRRVLTLLPDHHLCLVAAEAIVGLVPEAVARMAPSVRAGRPLTFVSGPSATSDIELSRVEGVHGPRTLDVVIMDA